MERIDVLRLNLLARARLLSPGAWIGSRGFLGFSTIEVVRQITWLIDAGLATGMVWNSQAATFPYARLTRLTERGKDYVDTLFER
jgi:hypothetical protein